MMDDLDSFTFDRFEAAKRLGVSADTVSKMVKTRRLSATKIGRSWRFTDYDIQQFISRNRTHVAGGRTAGSRAKTSPRK